MTQTPGPRPGAAEVEQEPGGDVSPREGEWQPPGPSGKAPASGNDRQAAGADGDVPASQDGKEAPGPVENAPESGSGRQAPDPTEISSASHGHRQTPGESGQRPEPCPVAHGPSLATDPAWGLPAGLAAMPVWRMALWCVPTLGLYLWLWLGLRREAFNSLDSPCKVWKWLFWTSFWMGLASGLFDAEPRPGQVLAFRAIGLSLSVAGSLAYLFLLFCAKAALEDHMEAQGLTLRASRWWLLLFGALYLQHVINRAHALLSETLSERAALQTGPIAASTPP